MKFVRISEKFELSEFELTGVNYYKMYYQIQGKLDLVRVSGEFELSEFELAGLYCIFPNLLKFRTSTSCTLLKPVAIRFWQIVTVDFSSQ